MPPILLKSIRLEMHLRICRLDLEDDTVDILLVFLSNYYAGYSNYLNLIDVAVERLGVPELREILHTSLQSQSNGRRSPHMLLLLYH